MLAAAFHLGPRPRPSFCFRGVSAAGYRSGSWNLILSSRFRERKTGGRGTMEERCCGKTRQEPPTEIVAERGIERESGAV